MTTIKPRVWFVCDERRGTPCIYSNEALGKLKSDPPRCIRHGALLFSTARHDGMSRSDVERDVRGGQKGDAGA
jgi:hypothetical protein